MKPLHQRQQKHKSACADDSTCQTESWSVDFYYEKHGKLYLSDSLSVNSWRKLITVSAKRDKNKNTACKPPENGSQRHKILTVLNNENVPTVRKPPERCSNLGFWPSFPLGLCVRRTRSPPAWPVCICISAALPNTPSALRWDRDKSCRRFLAPTQVEEEEGKFMTKSSIVKIA